MVEELGVQDLESGGRYNRIQRGTDSDWLGVVLGLAFGDGSGVVVGLEDEPADGISAVVPVGEGEGSGEGLGGAELVPEVGVGDGDGSGEDWVCEGVT